MWTVAAQLGLEEDGELLQQAHRRWPEWAAVEPRLGVVEKFDDLRGWLDSASHEEADRVLLALAMLAAPDGGDDLTAAAALAKCLLPGAARLAGRISGWLVDTPARRVMRDLQPVDSVSPSELFNQVVAAELWIQVRSFPWRRLTKVAGNIVTETRIGTLRELGQVADRNDRTWALTHPAEGLACGDYGGVGRAFTPDHQSVIAASFGCKNPALLISEPDQEQSADVELLEVLEWALVREVISAADRHLLLCLVEEAEQISDQLIDRGEFGGLLATRLSQRVGGRVGRGEATVRRHAARCVRALAAAVAADPEVVGDES
ncbi:hypothetical protein GCM10027596_40170 [Nocardioides korecus]